MTAAREVAVLKFGGTSLATPQAREIALRRVQESRERGFATVVVCSAMGRPPEPYATDTLISITPPASKPNANTDMLLACGELISAAAFAEMLTQSGNPARALTGAQAGILTDAQFGDAKIVRVAPDRIRDLLERDIVPVVAGFQGMTMAVLGGKFIGYVSFDTVTDANRAAAILSDLSTAAS